MVAQQMIKNEKFIKNCYRSYISADEVSVKTPSRKSSIRSSSSARRLSADDETLVPTISSMDRFQSDYLEPSDVGIPRRAPSAATDSSRSRSDRGQKKSRNKTHSKRKSTDTSASSSGMTPSERARALISPTTAPSSTEVPRERGSDSEGE